MLAKYVNTELKAIIICTKNIKTVTHKVHRNGIGKGRLNILSQYKKVIQKPWRENFMSLKENIQAFDVTVLDKSLMVNLCEHETVGKWPCKIMCEQ